jgi:hypothetical protein
MFIKRIAPFLVFALMAGCQTGPVTKSEMDLFDYGPKPVNWKETIRGYLNGRLTDASKAIVEFRTEPKILLQRSTAVRSTQYGWAVCVWVNDTDWSGKHEGFYPMTFFIRDEKIVAFNNGPEDFGAIGATYARRQCQELGAPFTH